MPTTGSKASVTTAATPVAAPKATSIAPAKPAVLPSGKTGLTHLDTDARGAMDTHAVTAGEAPKPQTAKTPAPKTATDNAAKTAADKAAKPTAANTPRFKGESDTASVNPSSATSLLLNQQRLQQLERDELQTRMLQERLRFDNERAEREAAKERGLRACVKESLDAVEKVQAKMIGMDLASKLAFLHDRPGNHYGEDKQGLKEGQTVKQGVEAHLNDVRVQAMGECTKRNKIVAVWD